MQRWVRGNLISECTKINFRPLPHPWTLKLKLLSYITMAPTGSNKRRRKWETGRWKETKWRWRKFTRCMIKSDEFWSFDGFDAHTLWEDRNVYKLWQSTVVVEDRKRHKTTTVSNGPEPRVVCVRTETSLNYYWKEWLVWSFAGFDTHTLSSAI